MNLLPWVVLVAFSASHLWPERESAAVWAVLFVFALACTGFWRVFEKGINDHARHIEELREAAQ